MEKLTCELSDGDTSAEERGKTVRDEKKVRTRKKKRKRHLTDLHQRLFKSRKDKETKIDRKFGKLRNLKKPSNRILPKPCAGIYRNGATGKEVRRTQTQLPVNDSNNARLGGDVLKLLHGYDSKSEGVVIGNEDKEASKGPLLDSAIKNILQPTPPGVHRASPILGKVDGKKKFQQDCDVPVAIEVPQKSVDKKTAINTESSSNFALSRYEELCKFVSAENFEGQNFLDQFTADPLTTVKRKLRSIYADSFRSQFLRDMINRGTILNEQKSPGTSVEDQLPREILYCTTGSSEETGLRFMPAENPNYNIAYRAAKAEDSQVTPGPFAMARSYFPIEGRRKEGSPLNLLFGSSILNSSNVELKNIPGKRAAKKIANTVDDDDSTSSRDHAYTKVNYPVTSAGRSDNNAEPHDAQVDRAQEMAKCALFLPKDKRFQTNFTNKRHSIRRKGQRTQAAQPLNSGLKRYAGRQNLKMPHPVKTKNLKHVPAILRRCNSPVTNNNDRVNLFEKSMHVNTEAREMLFDVASTQNTDNTTNTNDLYVGTCVMGSPSIRKDNLRFLGRSCSQTMIATQNATQNLHRNDIFVKKNPAIQKTVMFTKKDPRNTGHCLDLNSLIKDRSVDNSNVCIIKKNASVQQGKSSRNTCTGHRNCYRAFHCSQDSAGSNYESPEYNEAPQIQKPVACEKLLLRKVRERSRNEGNQKCNDQHVCYVVVDQCKETGNAQERVKDNVSHVEKSRVLQGGYIYQDDNADVGILKGVQNLKILPVEEREAQMNFVDKQCIERAVVVEEPPVKYLAFENDLETQRVPIYVQKNKHVASVENVGVVHPSYRVVSCPKKSTQKIVLVPTCEQNEVVYVKQQNMGRSRVTLEECSHPRKVVLYRPEVQCVQSNSNVCEIHVPKQNLIEIRNEKCDAVETNLQQADGTKKLRRNGVNWEELRYRPRHDHFLLNSACMRSQALFYQE